jgi:predicted HAD superfamily Cof-like phosphohydrolase
VADDAQVVGSESIDITNEEGEVIARYSFHCEEVDDVRQMLVRAAHFDNGKTPTVDHHWMKLVLIAQADMVSKGLHIRDHDFPDMIGDVNAFHVKFGQGYTGKPRALPTDLFDFRVKFHDEETGEYRDEQITLIDAIQRKDRRDIINSLELQLDALCDAVWVLLGTADLQFGRAAFIEAWRRVVKANMAKVRKDAAGEGHTDSGRAPKYDIVKPAGWMAPDHRDLVSDNAIFDEIFTDAPPPDSVEVVPTNQDPGYSDTRSV